MKNLKSINNWNWPYILTQGSSILMNAILCACVSLWLSIVSSRIIELWNIRQGCSVCVCFINQSCILSMYWIWRMVIFLQWTVKSVLYRERTQTVPINVISILCNTLEGVEFSEKWRCRVLKDTGAECEKHLIGQVASEQRLEGAEK